MTFRRVVIPAIVPSVAAGTVFTFSLSLGDYIAVQIVGGNPGPRDSGLPEHHLDLPFAAALGTVSVLVMIGYLAAVSRTGALENL